MNAEAPTDAGVVRRASLRDPALTGAVAVVAVGLLHWRDPHASGAYGLCPFLHLTGQPCPGCGGLRAVNDLTHGDVSGALTSNALAVLLMGVLAVAWIRWVIRRWRGTTDRMIVLTASTGYLVLAAVVVFTVFRWTPWGAWLYA